jgi:hypothetical protein
MGFLLRVGYTEAVMLQAASKSKSARDMLIESLIRLRAEAKERMAEAEFRKMEDQVHELANKVRAS